MRPAREALGADHIGACRGLIVVEILQAGGVVLGVGLAGVVVAVCLDSGAAETCWRLAGTFAVDAQGDTGILVTRAPETTT